MTAICHMMWAKSKELIYNIYYMLCIYPFALVGYHEAFKYCLNTTLQRALCLLERLRLTQISLGSIYWTRCESFRLSYISFPNPRWRALSSSNQHLFSMKVHFIIKAFSEGYGLPVGINWLNSSPFRCPKPWHWRRRYSSVSSSSLVQLLQSTYVY